MPRPNDEQVVEAIRALPARLRRPFVMAHVEGRSQEEIAAELCISQRRLERRLTRALICCMRKVDQ